MSKPAFDPNAPFEAAPSAKPAFDPAAPFEPAPAGDSRGVLGKIGDKLHDAVTGAASLGSILDPAMAALGAAGSYVVPNTAPEGASFKERWANEMEGLRRERGEAFKRSPLLATGAAMAMGAGGGLPIPTPASTVAADAAALMPQAAKLAPALLKAGGGVADAALLNSAYAAATNADKNPLAAAQEAAQSKWNLIGGIPGALDALKVGKEGLDAARQAAAPRFQPTPEALELQKLGVKNLTAGQMSPKSAIGQTEEVASNLPLIGPGFKNSRAQSQRSWMDLAVDAATPPGVDPAPAGKVAERLSSLNGKFNQAYGEFKDEMVYPALHLGGKGTALQSTNKSMGLFDMALQDPELAGVTDATRLKAERYLQNQLTRLPGSETRPNMLKPVPASDLLNMRSAIRTKIRDVMTGNATLEEKEFAAILGNAEDAITESLASQLPQESMQKLQGIDKAYSNFKTILDATAQAKGDFSPSQLLSSVARKSNRDRFAMGGGGELRKLADLGEAVFNPELPQTGVQMVATMPGAKWLTGLMAYGANTPAGKEFLLRQPTPGAGQPGLMRMLEQGRPTPQPGSYLSQDDDRRRMAALAAALRLRGEAQ